MCLVSSSVFREAPTGPLSDFLSVSVAQPHSSFILFLSISVFLRFPLVCLLVSMSLTHPHSILITHPPIQDYFHWHTTKWPSDRAHTEHPQSRIAFIPSFERLSVHLWVEYGKRHGATDDCLKALKGENNSISQFTFSSHCTFFKAKTV